MIQNFDLKHGMMMSFKIHVSEHQVVHIGIFPDEETSNNFSEVTKQARKQIADMGVKAEPLAGPLTDMLIAHDITLGQLTAKGWPEQALGMARVWSPRAFVRQEICFYDEKSLIAHENWGEAE